ncbi:MAG: hypothetical protein U0270_01570 [Labilithrix sp.]
MKNFALGLFALLSLTGCPSKESSSSSGATSPAPVGSGPLANLESQPSAPEQWTAQDGRALPMVYFSGQNVRVSAGCKQPNGQLVCDAIRQLRGAPPIEVSGRGSPSLSMGTKACMKMHYAYVTGRNSVGAEDGFCTFPDGSMVSAGALEQYGVRVIQ